MSPRRFARSGSFLGTFPAKTGGCTALPAPDDVTPPPGTPPVLNLRSICRELPITSGFITLFSASVVLFIHEVTERCTPGAFQADDVPAAAALDLTLLLSTADVTFATGGVLLQVLSLAVKLDLSLIEGGFSSFNDNF